MTFMTINGLTIPIKDASLRKTDAEFGSDRARSAGGEFMAPIPRGIKRVWDCTTKPLLGRTAEEMEAWITGAGMWHVSFDDGIQGDYGITPEAGHHGIVQTSVVKFAGGAALQFQATPQDMGWIVPRASPESAGSRNCTMAAWYSLDAATFQHLALTVRNAVATWYIDGVVTGSAILNLTISDVSSGLLMSLFSKTIAGSNDTVVTWDDLVMANWPMNASMIAAMYARTTKFSAAPTMEMEGTLIQQAEPVLVRGVMQQGDYNQGRGSADSAWQNNMRTLSFRLEER
jgi:hypothetical protein